MNESGSTRRDFVKKAAYVAPAILTLAAVPSYAKFGSDKSDLIGSGTGAIGGIGNNVISNNGNSALSRYNRLHGNGNTIGHSGNNGIDNNGIGNSGNDNSQGNNNQGNNGDTGNSALHAQSPFHSSALANYRARHGLTSVISPTGD